MGAHSTSRRGGSILVVMGLALTLTSCGSGTAKHMSPSGTWTRAASMHTAREGGGSGLGTWSARLPDGKVLVAGGYNTLSGKFEIKPEFFLNSSEIYDPASDTWKPTGAMRHPRFGAAVVVLPKTGEVLAAGGAGAVDNATVSSSAEVFDPRAGQWRLVAPMSTCRVSPSASVLASGDVVLVGGLGCDGNAQASTEIFRAATGEWAPAAAMGQARWGHSATILPDGRVLVAGGRSTPVKTDHEQVLASAEIYDPVHDTWKPAAPLHTARTLHVAALLTSGRVVVAGGHGQDPHDAHSATPTAELYDPAADAWAPTGSMQAGREEGGSLLLSDGTLLVAGGGQQAGAEIYHPATGTWSQTGAMTAIHDDAQLTMLDTGEVLIAGGFAFTDQGYRNTAAAELFHPPG